MDLGVKIAMENHSGDHAGPVNAPSSRNPARTSWRLSGYGKPDLVHRRSIPHARDLAPYAVTTHVRDSIVFETPHGAAGQWVAMGDGILDLPRFVAEFRKRCPQSTMQLEIITGRPPRPLNYLDADFWKAFPKMPAWEFARFVALAKSGHPFMGAMVVEDVPGRPR